VRDVSPLRDKEHRAQGALLREKDQLPVAFFSFCSAIRFSR
jgi:hypothetical protein